MSLNIAVSEEAMQEGKAYLNSKKAFIGIDGKLRYGFNTDIGNLLLHCFSCGLEEQNRVEIQELSDKDTYIVDISMAINKESAFITYESTQAGELETLRRFTNGKNHYYGILLYGETVGLIRVTHHSANKCTIGMGLLQVHTQKGIGKEAMALLLVELKQLGYREILLRVHEKNYGALALYRSTGFLPTQEIKDNYIFMVKYI